MEELNAIKEQLKEKMEKTIEACRHNLNGLRTGRASASLLDPITVEAYGSMMPMNQVATITASAANMITVQVWDKENVKKVDKAISEANLGLSPITEGNIVRVPIPQLSADRRADLCKKAKEYGEQGKISIRNIRRSGIDEVKKLEKNKEISEDISKGEQNKIQKITDDFIKKIDNLVEEKEKDIKVV